MGTNMFISTFTFGGGYIVVPMVRQFFVAKKKLFSEEELIDMAAVAQSTPGAIAINLAALAGYRVAGKVGSIISVISAIMPPLIILSIISAFYNIFITNPIIVAILKGMEAGVAALMVDLIIDMCSMILKKKSLLLSLMIPVSFICNYILNINVVLILVCSSLICIIHVLYKRGMAQ